jgi:hypothetical protein
MVPLHIIIENNVTLMQIKNACLPEIVFEYTSVKSIDTIEGNEDEYISVDKIKYTIYNLYEDEDIYKIKKYISYPVVCLIQFADFHFFKRFIKKNTYKEFIE